ncbi:GEM-like protein 1 [Senna tora]|uniref:GEM-like protein 1 n=1 Tax=Senna tora TaxID=362788 RepID=A0A834X1E6_9FABA|nr:GEM-like protein 1 [Senna tora]
MDDLHREIPIRSSTNPGWSASFNNNNHNPYIHVSPISTSSPHNNGPNPINTICDALHRCGKTVEKATKQAENMADSFWNHNLSVFALSIFCQSSSCALIFDEELGGFRLSSNPADAAMARLVQGTKVLTQGGHDRMFQNTFGILQGEKFLKQYACYISTVSGPIIGTLYISNKRLAFCSDYPLYHYPFSLQGQSIYYKVVVEVDQLSRVTPSTNRLNPLEKYIMVVTVDGYEFIFMGFIAYDKALKTISEALRLYRNQSSQGQSQSQS